MSEPLPLPEPAYFIGADGRVYNHERHPSLHAWDDKQMHAYAAAAVAAERKWRETVDDMLVCQHEVASDDPRESINRLINWSVMCALDPAISSEAAKLVAAERERCLSICEEHYSIEFIAQDIAAAIRAQP
jgi:hypothetical protein